MSTTRQLKESSTRVEELERAVLVTAEALAALNERVEALEEARRPPVKKTAPKPPEK